MVRTGDLARQILNLVNSESVLLIGGLAVVIENEEVWLRFKECTSQKDVESGTRQASELLLKSQVSGLGKEKVVG